MLKRVTKPKTRRVKRALDERAPKTVENTKTAMFVKGGKTSDCVTSCLRELASLKKPESIMLKKKNPFHPFDDSSPFEKFSSKYDASLFAFGSHSKKRPNNIVFGRTFNYQLLDMVEVGVDNFKSMHKFAVEKPGLGNKPCLYFAGEQFDQVSELKMFKNMMIDMFRGPVVPAIALQGIDHVMAFICKSNSVVLVRQYRVLLKKSGTRLPRVELAECGPAMDFTLRRTRFASEDLRRDAMRQPKVLKVKKVKNVEYDPLGNKLGRIHMQQQDLAELRLHKMKGLKRRAMPEENENGGENENENFESSRDDSDPEELSVQSSTIRKGKNRSKRVAHDL